MERTRNLRSGLKAATVAVFFAAALFSTGCSNNALMTICAREQSSGTAATEFAPVVPKVVLQAGIRFICSRSRPKDWGATDISCSTSGLPVDLPAIAPWVLKPKNVPWEADW